MIGEFAFIAVLGLAVIHVIAGKLRFLEGTPLSRWLSIAGGISVAYVFMHLLPELSEGQSVLSEALEGGLSFLENHVYLVALLGLVVFPGLDRAALISRQQRDQARVMTLVRAYSGCTSSPLVCITY